MRKTCHLLCWRPFNDRSQGLANKGAVTNRAISAKEIYTPFGIPIVGNGKVYSFGHSLLKWRHFEQGSVFNVLAGHPGLSRNGRKSVRGPLVPWRQSLPASRTRRPTWKGKTSLLRKLLGWGKNRKSMMGCLQGSTANSGLVNLPICSMNNRVITLLRCFHDQCCIQNIYPDMLH